MEWEQVVNEVSKYIVRIETPNGYGTGFVCLYNEDKSICGIATALHVVEHSSQWEQPIRIFHDESNKHRLLKEEDRMIFRDYETDSAVIVFQTGEDDIPLPTDLIQLHETGSPISIGVKVGWLGFPQIQSYTLCFFSGNISAWLDFRKAYLIDGVSINGVSGGPVLYVTQDEKVEIVGIISAYRANRALGEALPGLSIAQDVSHFHNVVARVRSFDEAKKKQVEETKQSNGGKKPPSPKNPIEEATFSHQQPNPTP